MVTFVIRKISESEIVIRILQKEVEFSASFSVIYIVVKYQAKNTLRKKMYRAIKDRVVVSLNKIVKNQVIINNEKPLRNQGKVVSVGDEVVDIKVGDEIIFHKYDELPLPYDDLVVVRAKSVLCLVRTDAE